MAHCMGQIQDLGFRAQSCCPFLCFLNYQSQVRREDLSAHLWILGGVGEGCEMETESLRTESPKTGMPFNHQQASLSPHAPVSP